MYRGHEIFLLLKNPKNYPKSFLEGSQLDYHLINKELCFRLTVYACVHDHLLQIIKAGMLSSYTYFTTYPLAQHQFYFFYFFLPVKNWQLNEKKLVVIIQTTWPGIF